MADDGPAPRRCRRAGWRHPHAPACVGSVGARGEFHRPAGRVPQLPQAVPARRSPEGRRARGRVARQEARPLGRALSELRRAQARGPAAVQPHVQDVRRTGRGHRIHRVAPAGNGAIDLRRLRERPADDAKEAPVRDRADRQGVPQRDHPRQLHLPIARVRADGDAVLHAPVRCSALLRRVEGNAPRVACRAGHPEREDALPRSRR